MELTEWKEGWERFRPQLQELYFLMVAVSAGQAQICSLKPTTKGQSAKAPSAPRKGLT